MGIWGFRFWKKSGEEPGIFMEYEKEGGGQKNMKKFFLLPFIALDMYAFGLYTFFQCSVTNVSLINLAKFIIYNAIIIIKGSRK